jgi:hypothetical protein
MIVVNMIVVNMIGAWHATDRADAALLGQKLVKLLLADAVATPQVVLVGAAVQPLLSPWSRDTPTALAGIPPPAGAPITVIGQTVATATIAVKRGARKDASG